MTAGKRTLVVVGLVVLIAGSGYGVYRWQAGSPAGAATPAGNEAPRARGVPVIAAAATRQPVPFEITAIGQVTPWQSVAVKPRIDGQIYTVNFHPGDEVKAGQVLFKLDDRQLLAQLAQAQATLARDRASLANFKREAERQSELSSKEFTTKKSFEDARTQVEVTESTVKADLASIDNLKVQVSYCTIVAPIEGRVGDVLLTAGNNVRVADVNPMVTIIQLHPIAVQFGIPQRYFTMVRQVTANGTAETLAIPAGGSGKTLTGRLTFLDNTIDPATGSFQVKAEFANTDSALWPGMFVNVTVRLGGDENALVVPNAAVMNGQQGPYTYVVKADATVEARPIVVARTTPTVAVIEKGLQPGEQVVIEGQLRVTNGTRVEVRKPGESAAVATEEAPQGGRQQAAARNGRREGSANEGVEKE
jgi:multidrug efflux system membrane fusion protein